MQSGATLSQLALTASGRLAVSEGLPTALGFTHDASGAFQVCQPPGINAVHAPASDDSSQQGGLGATSSQHQVAATPKRAAAAKHAASLGQAATESETSEERRKKEEERIAKVKLKNKRAQQRFRERQKAKSSETQSEVARLRVQVVQLQAALAEEHHKRRLLDPPQVTGSGVSQQAAGLQSVPMETELKADCAVPPGNVFEPRFGWEAVHPEAPLLLSLCSGGPRTFTPDQLRRRQYAEHTALWKEYVELLASNMVEAQGDESSPAAGRVRGLVNELTGYACTMVKVNPEVMHTFFSRESNTGSAASLQWRHILKALELSEEQKRDMMTARRFCLTSMSALMHERLRLFHSLKKEGLTDVDGLSGICEAQLAGMGLVQALQHNLTATNETFRHFMFIVHKRVLTLFQLATVIVQAYPAAEDMLAFVNHLARDMGEPSAKELLNPQVSST
ncbi:hypothetical protein WJX73_007882 [Symbiochloris irregularis]|uniref:BZIP domain-containing protein n=1 Tax=Symbiochloris irregularis TaxID=706552 RepID=A0AAW1PSR4_9CHLO